MSALSSVSGSSRFSPKDYFVQWLATNSPSNDWVADIKDIYESPKTDQNAFVKAIFERVGNDFSKLNSQENRIFLSNWVYYKKTRTIGTDQAYESPEGSSLKIVPYSDLLRPLQNITPKEALERLLNFKKMDEATPLSLVTKVTDFFSQLINPGKSSKADLSLVRVNLPGYIDLWVNQNKIPPKSLGIDNEEKARFFITQYGKYVHHIDLREFGSLIFDITIEKVIEYCPDIHSILVSSDNITNRSAFAIADNCPNLIHLDFSGCRQITREAILLIRDKCPKLKNLVPHPV